VNLQCSYFQKLNQNYLYEIILKLLLYKFLLPKMPDALFLFNRPSFFTSKKSKVNSGKLLQRFENEFPLSCPWPVLNIFECDETYMLQ